MKRIVGRIVGLMIVLNTLFALALLALKRIVPSVGDEESNVLALATIMDGRELVSHATAFRGGSALTLAGGMVIDLRGARLAPEGAHLQLNTIMGGTSLIVPEGWRVEVKGPAVMGAIEDKAAKGEPSLAEDAPTLVVEALSVMGGIDIARRATAADAGRVEHVLST